MKGKGWTLSAQLSFIVIATCLVIALGATYFLQKWGLKELLKEQENIVNNYVGLYSLAVLEAIISEDIPALETVVSATRETNNDLLAVNIKNEAGNMLIDWVSDDMPDETPAKTFSRDIYYQGEKFGLLNITLDTSQLKIKTMHRARSIFGVTVLIIVILAALLSVAVYWLVVRHVIFINRKISSIGTEDRLKISACSELMNLAESVNDLADEYALRLKREDELKIAQQSAENASRAKSHFLSSMSHELRTPMNAVLGFAQLLSFEDLTTEQQDSVNEILVAGQHMLSLIDDVLDLSRIESGQPNVNPEMIAIEALIKESLTLVNHSAQEKGVTISFDMQGNDNVNVLADKIRLKQVLINLLTNAIKYNRVQGNVEVCVKTAENNRVRINISDTGYGLDKSQLEDLFIPFCRLDAMEKGIDGLGIGLVICKRLIEAMGGRIGVNSSIGFGSTFWIELKINKAVISSSVGC